MKPPAVLWKLRARGLEEARQAVKRGSPEGLHDLRVALRRLAITSAALGRKRLAGRAKSIARSLSRSRQLEVDRRLLERIGRLGLLSPDAVTALAARWEKVAGRGVRRLARATDGKRMQKLRRRLETLARKRSGRGLGRLGKARREAEQALSRLSRAAMIGPSTGIAPRSSARATSRRISRRSGFPKRPRRRRENGRSRNRSADGTT